MHTHDLSSAQRFKSDALVDVQRLNNGWQIAGGHYVSKQNSLVVSENVAVAENSETLAVKLSG